MTHDELRSFAMFLNQPRTADEINARYHCGLPGVVAKVSELRQALSQSGLQVLTLEQPGEETKYQLVEVS